MPQPTTLTGQDVGEAEGALTALLDQLLADTDAGITRTQYIVLRILALRGPAESPAALHDVPCRPAPARPRPPPGRRVLPRPGSQGPGHRERPDGPGPIQLTPEGAALHARLADAVANLTQRLYADLDPDDLATAHRVLVEITQRANRLRGQP